MSSGVLAGRGRLLARARVAVAATAMALLAAAAIEASSVAVPALATGSLNAAPVPVKTISYLGYSFQVPRSWPVIDNSKNPQGCVRFDQHAVYLGQAGANQFCPSWLLGTTESMLIQAGPAGVTRSATDNPVARQVTARAPGIVVTATFAANPALIYQILASAGLPAPVVMVPQPASQAGVGGLVAQAGQPGQGNSQPKAVVAPQLPVDVASYHGLGFDACAAPSQSYMNAWLRGSPYRAIGIYIGGADRACAQPNLTSAWVRRQAQNGWRYLPLYVGPQASFGELSSPQKQAVAAAADAVAAAQRLGFGAGTPIYYDMEAYSSSASTAALRFLSAWTTSLHRLGYLSGAYSSSDSGVADLARQYSRGIYTMPDILYDALWNGQATTSDAHLTANMWVNHRRVHQFTGNITKSYGGASINIDQDFLDVSLSRAGGTPQASPAISLPDGSVYVFYRSGNHQLYLERYQAKSGWAQLVRTGGTAWSVPSAVWTGSAIDVFYTDQAGDLWQDRYRTDGTLAGRGKLAMMGRLGSGPAAVAAAGGLIDVFWRGSADRHLWHGQYQPGVGWSGPQGLGGDLASPPAPVVSSAGTTEVFFKGGDGNLWQVSRGMRGGWSAAASLGMGPLGGAPQATAQPSGAIEVYWSGSADSHLWQASYQPGRGWRGPAGLGGTLAAPPWPVSAQGTVRVLWRGQRDQVYARRHRAGAKWGLAGWDGPLAVGATAISPRAPFAAVGQPGGKVWAFWWGPAGELWSASLGATGGWSIPAIVTATAS